jgi:hypothetical protein
MKPSYALFNVFAFGIVGLLLVVASVALILTGHGFITAILLGLAWGVVGFGIVLSLGQVIAPAALIRWRDEILSSTRGDVARSLGATASRVLAISGPDPWNRPSAKLRVRIYGAVSLVVFIAVGVLLIVIAGPLDSAMSWHS